MAVSHFKIKCQYRSAAYLNVLSFRGFNVDPDALAELTQFTCVTRLARNTWAQALVASHMTSTFIIYWGAVSKAAPSTGCQCLLGQDVLGWAPLPGQLPPRTAGSPEWEPLERRSAFCRRGKDKGKRGAACLCSCIQLSSTSSTKLRNDTAIWVNFWAYSLVTEIF